MRRALSLTVWLGLTAACGSEAPRDDAAPAPRVVHPSERRARLAVADAAAPRVSVVDLEDRAVIAELDVDARATFAETERREHALLLHREPPGVQALWGGVSVLAHVEDYDSPHVHIYKFDPEVVPVGGADWGEPTAAWSRNGVTALLSATSRGASAHWFFESGLEPGAAVELTALEVPLAELTGVVALGDGWLSSGVDERGTGVFLQLDADGATLDEGSCEAPSGLFAAPSFTALSCGRELVRLGPVSMDAPPTIERFPISESAPPLVVTGYADLETLLIRDANGAAWALDSDGLKALALPANTCELALEPARGEAAVALGSDGVLRRVSLRSGEVEESLRVTEAFACASSVRPRLALAPERAFVSEPSTGLVHDVLVTPLAVVRSYPVAGEPMHLSVLGLDPRTRDLGPGDGLD
jgi:hypothetical protein